MGNCIVNKNQFTMSITFPDISNIKIQNILDNPKDIEALYL